jgi:hypothetical protein
MLTRLGQVLYWASFGIAAVALSSCVSVRDLPPELRKRTECAAASLKSIPNVSGVHIAVRHDSPGGNLDGWVATVSFFADTPRTQRLTLILFANIDGTPLGSWDGTDAAAAIIGMFADRCDLGTIFIT